MKSERSKMSLINIRKLVILMAVIKVAASITIVTTDTCTDRCLEPDISSEGCRCDSNCIRDDECCEDYVALCLNTTSCSGRCLETENPFNGGISCSCDERCSEFNNCCDDFIPLCASEDKCENRCFRGYFSSLPCQCNDMCKDFGNCCDDWDSTCALQMCEGRCGTAYDPSLPCQCNDQCEQYKNCCNDYVLECGAPSCVGLCGKFVSGNACQCNEGCLQYGDCCQDYQALCDNPYLCNGKCNVTRANCNCTADCMDTNYCCTDYAQTCEGGTGWVEDECTQQGEMKCPVGFGKSPVIMMSIDGFQASYIHRNYTPNIQKLAECGVHAPYMRSAYPSLTFPNHYTIATGLYPESHGITANRMYDHDLKEEFRLGGSNSFHPYWWGGEPIWVTASNQGLKSATYFWVGSDVNITRYPDYYYVFDSSVPNEERMHQALRWLDMEPEDRPDIILLYMDIVDHAGHDSGPVSEGMDATLKEADNQVGILMDGLKQRNLHNCVDLIILADHGMAPISCDRLNYVEDEGVNMDEVYFRSGAAGRLGRSIDESIPFNAEDNLKILECKREELHWQAFIKYEYFPRRLHYADNDRIEDVQLLLDDEWLCGGRSGSYSTQSCSGGNHGFDTEFSHMNALFVSHGPDFKRNYDSFEPFENIEVYNLLSELLDITAAPNNGTKGSLKHILSNPSAIEITTNNHEATTCSYPTDDTPDGIACEECLGYTTEQANRRFKEFNAVEESQKTHLPFGIPQVLDSPDSINYCILSHQEYVNAYDKNRKLPLFVGFTRNMMFPYVSSPNCVRPDVRITASATTTQCSLDSQDDDIVQAFLYNPELSYSTAQADAAITSNIVPMYKTFVPIWNYLSNEFNNWAGLYGTVSIITGPVFDYNYDGKADTNKILQSQGKYMGERPIPTHFFIVAYRCIDEEQTIEICKSSPRSVDIINFIIPNYAKKPCHKVEETENIWIPRELVEHVARLRDVELITGLSFFSDWTSKESVNQELMQASINAKLRLPQFSGLWVNNFKNHVTGTPNESPTDANEITTTCSTLRTLQSHKLMAFVIMSYIKFISCF